MMEAEGQCWEKKGLCDSGCIGVMRARDYVCSNPDSSTTMCMVMNSKASKNLQVRGNID